MTESKHVGLVLTLHVGLVLTYKDRRSNHPELHRHGVKHAKLQPKEARPIITFDPDVNLSGFLLDCSLHFGEAALDPIFRVGFYTFLSPSQSADCRHRWIGPRLHPEKRHTIHTGTRVGQAEFLPDKLSTIPGK